MKNILFYPTFIFLLVTMYSCQQCKYDGERKRLTDTQRSWTEITDTTQQFLYYKIDSSGINLIDTLAGTMRFVRDTSHHIGECYYSEDEVIKVGLRIAKKDSVYQVYVFEENTDPFKNSTNDKLKYDTLRVDTVLYQYVFKTEGYKDTTWYAKGIGFIKIKNKNQLFELIP